MRSKLRGGRANQEDRTTSIRTMANGTTLVINGASKNAMTQTATEVDQQEVEEDSWTGSN